MAILQFVIRVLSFKFAKEDELLVFVFFPGTDMYTCAYGSSTCGQEVYPETVAWGTSAPG